MAKSLRSKWKRKMRAVKRERYGEKEDTRLIKMLTAAGEYPQVEGADIKVEDITENDSVLITSIPRRSSKSRRIKPRAEGRKSRRDQAEEDVQEIHDNDNEEMESENDGEKDADDEGMAVDKPNHVFSKRTMKDQFGNYPAWMNKRKMQTQQKKNKRIAKRRAMSVAGRRCKKLK